MTYSEKLKDPRWQKKRLEILERDEFTCQVCFDTENTLHVHHKHYEWGVDPWDCPDCLLMTVCEGCHEYLKDASSDIKTMTRQLLQRGANERDVAEMLLGLLKLQEASRWPDEVMGDMMKWITRPRWLDDASFFDVMSKAYWDDIKKIAAAKKEAG